MQNTPNSTNNAPLPLAWLGMDQQFHVPTIVLHTYKMDGKVFFFVHRSTGRYYQLLENKNSYKLLQTPLYIVPHCHIIPYNPLLLLLLTYNPSSWFAVFHLILWLISISYFVVQSKRRSFLGIPSHMINFTGKNSRFA